MNSCYLMMTNRCNMACSYCYEREYFKDNFKDISEETAKQAIDFLVSNHKPGNKARPNEDINICYFGGEPTLNWEVLKKNIVYARSLEKEKGLKFGLYLLTNAKELPNDEAEFFRVLRDHGVKMQVSLDGCKEAHDSTRGHFDAIVKNTRKIIENLNRHIIVRMTVTPDNVRHAYESFRAMAELSCTVNMVPIVEDEWTSDTIAIAKEEFKKIMNYYQKLTRIKPIRFNVAENCIDGGFRHCQTGSSMISVTVDGTIYPCHRFQFHAEPEKNWKMGDIFKGVDRYPNFDGIFAKCYSCETNICHPCPSAFILKNSGRAPEYYCKWNKEIEELVRPQASEVRAYNEKEVYSKKLDLILEGLGEIQKCVKKS